MMTLDRSIAVAQINTNKAYLAAVEIKQHFKGKKDFVALITEPYTKENKVKQIPTNSKVIEASGKTRNRAAIVAH